MHFLHAGGFEHAHDLTRGRTADDGVVDEHDPLPRHELAYWIELHLHPEVADGLLWLDERPADVVVPDQAIREGNPGLTGVAEGREHARIGNGDDDVGVDGAFARQLRAEALAYLGYVIAEDHGVWPCEVDVLEDAARLAGRLELMDGPESRAAIATINRDHLAG